MSKKITYEKPMIIDLTGRDEVHGAAQNCGKGSSATGLCGVGNAAMQTCQGGKGAVGTYCGVGQQAIGQCQIGQTVRHS